MMKPERIRMTPKGRRDIILQAAIHLTGLKGFGQVSSRDIATSAPCSQALIRHYFATMDSLNTEVMRWAIDNKNTRILCEGLALRHPAALEAPLELKQAAQNSLTCE